MADKIELLIKKYLEGQAKQLTGRRENVNYPSSLDLYHYLNEELEGAELERMLGFLKNNEEGQELVIRAREIMQDQDEWEKETVSPDMVKKAKALMSSNTKNSVPCPHCGKPITPFKKPPSSQKWTNFAWLVLAIGSLALSFVFHHYFIQFLVVTALAGMKYIVEMRASKTQILIYKALTGEHGPEQHRLHQHSSRL